MIDLNGAMMNRNDCHKRYPVWLMCLWGIVGLVGCVSDGSGSGLPVKSSSVARETGNQTSGLDAKIKLRLDRQNKSKRSRDVVRIEYADDHALIIADRKVGIGRVGLYSGPGGWPASIYVKLSNFNSCEGFIVKTMDGDGVELKRVNYSEDRAYKKSLSKLKGGYKIIIDSRLLLDEGASLQVAWIDAYRN